MSMLTIVSKLTKLAAGLTDVNITGQQTELLFAGFLRVNIVKLGDPESQQFL